MIYILSTILFHDLLIGHKYEGYMINLILILKDMYSSPFIA